MPKFTRRTKIAILSTILVIAAVSFFLIPVIPDQLMLLPVQFAGKVCLDNGFCIPSGVTSINGKDSVDSVVSISYYLFGTGAILINFHYFLKFFDKLPNGKNQTRA
jgi:hypothetical protein